MVRNLEQNLYFKTYIVSMTMLWTAPHLDCSKLIDITATFKLLEILKV